MTQNDADWKMDMEESAQGTDLFEAPGKDIQSSEAKQDAVEFAAGEDATAGSSQQVEQARSRRRSLGAAMANLEEVVAGPSGAEGWHDSVSSALDELRLALDEHIQVTEGEGGLLSEILEVAPRFAAEVDLTKAEHEGLVEALTRAVLTLEGAREIASRDPEPVRRRVMTVLGRLSLHRQRGADLVYDAYNVDIATGD